MRQDEQYQVVVGLEIHVQIKTNSKIFSADLSAYGNEPNANIGTNTLAHPGTLPKLNRRVVESAVKMGLACQCEITREFIFDRKNYFYPDLPKGYQLTQDRTPICLNGYIPCRLKGASRKVKLFDIHLEEDAGKSVHDSGIYTAVDYNRAGMPLIEIVTQPEIYSAEEADAVLSEVRRIVRYLDISDGDMEKGSMRCDANISIKSGDSEELGKKVEIKNMNSIRNVGRAITYEKRRQIQLLEKGEDIASETRTFHAPTGKTIGMRMKEELNDYRYFPDPDLGSVSISEEELNSWIAEMPELPQQLFDVYTREYKLPVYDAEVLIEEPDLATFASELFEITSHQKPASNWLMGPVKSWLNHSKVNMDSFPLSTGQLNEIICLIYSKKLGYTNAVQKLFPYLLEHPTQDVELCARELNLYIEEDSSNVQNVINEIMTEFPDKVKAYQKGKKGLLGMFMGEVMKRTKGKVDAKTANQILTKSLENLKYFKT